MRDVWVMVPPSSRPEPRISFWPKVSPHRVSRPLSESFMRSERLRPVSGGPYFL